MVESWISGGSEISEQDEVRVPLAATPISETNGNGCHANGHHPKPVANGHTDSEIRVVRFAEPEMLETLDCGMFSFRPNWLQPLANKKAFLVVFCLTSVLQGMYYTYFVSVLTTIEKLFQIQSKTTGIIMSATEIGQIGGALLLTYYGGQGHRPKWISFGMLIFAGASILCSTPHFIFGTGEDYSHKYSQTGPINASAYKLRELNARLCHDLRPFKNVSRSELSKSPRDIPSSIDSFFSENTTNDGEVSVSKTHFYKGRLASRCDSPDNTAYQNKVTHAVLAVFFVSLFFIGIGATAVYTLGIPYIDDNVATRESPLYFGITIGVRIFGPVFGFLLGSFCTSIYLNFPFANPGITSDDPQWIGAWWLGVFIVGAALIFTSIPMMCFPKKLPGQGSVKPTRNGTTANRHTRHTAPAAPVRKNKKPSLKDPYTPSRKSRMAFS